jgi:Domain of unknown function (DUF5658)
VQSGQAFAGIRLSVRDAVIRGKQGRATLLWVLYALNLADALLTSVALRTGVAVEGNPVVHVIGLPGKIALVTVAGYLVSVLRPRALLIPVVALGLTVVWTAVNLLLA